MAERERRSDQSTVAGVPYLNRIFELLRLVAEQGSAGARVPEIAEQMGIHRVSVHRIIKPLLELGYLEQGPKLSYHLGFEVWLLGIAASQRFVPPKIVVALKKLSDETEECAFLMRRAGNEGVCIDVSEGTFPIRSLVMRVGTRRRLGVGGTSMAILANLPPEEAEKIISENIDEYRRFGLTTADIHRLASEARGLGYTYSQGVVAPESRTIAVPLDLSGDPAAMMSISIVTLHSRLLPPRREKIVDLLKEAAAKLRSSAP